MAGMFPFFKFEISENLIIEGIDEELVVFYILESNLSTGITIEYIPLYTTIHLYPTFEHK